MAKTLPINFDIPAEGAIASYDWFDFATGAGYKKFYCVGGYNSTEKQYILTTEDMRSDAENQSSGDLGAGTTNYSFDVTWGRPITIAGADAFMYFTQYTTVASTSYMTCTVYHVTVGGTETSIGSGISDTGGAVAPGHKKLFKFTLTKKSFGIGEKLRVKLSFTSNGSSNGFYYNGFIDSGGANVELSIRVPFIVQP